MSSTRGKRPIGPGERKLPRGIDRKDKSPDRCSRCGGVGVRYICGPCKSALTVASRQRNESVSPAKLRKRRKSRRDYMRRKRKQARAQAAISST